MSAEQVGQAGQVFVVSAPSGAGKSTVVAALRQRLPALGYSISLTTRPPRPGEQNGVHYHFVSREDFLARVEAGDMVEHAEVFGNLYGTSAEVVSRALAQGQDILLEIDVAGAAQIKARFPEAALIFLLPPSRGELERRLRGRGSEDEATIRLRLDGAARELGQARHFTHVVVNERVQDAAADIAAIIRADGLRLPRRWEALAASWGL
jgi:guanylate kinase